MKRYNKYGEIAILTIKNNKPNKPLKETWFDVSKTLIESKSSIEKGCPRSTFLGLCEEGLVVNIPKGNYESNSTINKNHAIEAVQYLKSNKIDTIATKDLWSKLNVGNKSHNSQMDVVLALWYNNLIVKKKNYAI